MSYLNDVMEKLSDDMDESLSTVWEKAAALRELADAIEARENHFRTAYLAGRGGYDDSRKRHSDLARDEGKRIKILIRSLARYFPS